MSLCYSKLFQDPRVDYPHLSQQLSFAEYIAQCKTLIKNTRLDLQDHADKIIEANAPYELYPENTSLKKIPCGALLIHGLLDCPFTMRDIGKELQKNGLLVRSVLLPGHGTIPGALLHTDYTEWLKTVRYGIETLAKEVEHIFLVGYSTGGALALYQAEKEPDKIAGVILLSPALKINCLFDFLAHWPAQLGKIWPRAAWFHIDRKETLDYTRYLSTPFNAAYQVYRLTRELKKMNSPSCPLFFALTKNDVTVLSKACIKYFLDHKNPKNRMILYNKKGAKMVFKDNRILTRSSCYADQRIMDFSHFTLPIAPTNAHYGIQGDFCDASKVESILYGEHYIPLMNFHNVLFKLKLAHYQYQRLHFNPDFSFLIEQMKQFMTEATTSSLLRF